MKKPYLDKWNRIMLKECPDSLLAISHNLKWEFRTIQREIGKTFNPYLKKAGLKIKGTR